MRPRAVAQTIVPRKIADCERISGLRQITQILKHRRSRGVRQRWIGESCVGAMNAVSRWPAISELREAAVYELPQSPRASREDGLQG